MKVTLASFHDLAELASFARATYKTAYSEEMGLRAVMSHIEANMSDHHFEEMIKSDTFYLVRESTQIIGFAQIGAVDISYQKFVTDFNPGGSELRRLYVLAEAQSKGVGSTLIEHVLQDPFIANTASVYLTTWESNHGAQRLYRKYNFEKIGEIPEYETDGTLSGYEYIMVRHN